MARLGIAFDAVKAAELHMTAVGTFPSPGRVGTPSAGPSRRGCGVRGAAVILWPVVRVGGGMTTPWASARAPSAVSTDPVQLPYYAFSANDARQQLDIAISWGRYAELFEHNTHIDQITGEIPKPALTESAAV